MTAQKMFHGLADGKLHVHHSTVAKHHDEKAQSSSGFAHGDRSIGSPIDLRTFTWGKRQLQKGLDLWRPDLSHIFFNNGIATVKVVFPYPLEDLNRRVRMGFQHTYDLTFERIELAGTAGRVSGLVLLFLNPFFNRAIIKIEFSCDLAAF